MKKTIAVLVENHFGVLSHVSGLFSARGFNIDSLAVGETEDPTVSRMTIVVDGDEKTLEQVKKQLNRLIDVIKVIDLTEEDFIDRELVLVKVAINTKNRSEILQVADTYDEYIHGLRDRPGMLPAIALKQIYQAAKKGRFSETVVSALIHVMGIYPLTSAVLLSTGEKGVVVEIDKRKPLLPRVRIVYGADGERCSTDTILDLSEQESEGVKVVRVIDPIDKHEDPLGLLAVTEV